MANTNYTAPMSDAQFRFAQRRYPILIVNYFAPWCPWCQRLAPTWEAVMKYAHSTYPTSDGRIRVAKVDCTVEVVRPSIIRLHAVPVECARTVLVQRLPAVIINQCLRQTRISFDLERGYFLSLYSQQSSRHFLQGRYPKKLLHYGLQKVLVWYGTPVGTATAAP